MKIKDIVKESSGQVYKTLKDWLSYYRVNYEAGSNSYDYEAGLEEDLIDASGRLHRGIDEMHFTAIKDVTFEWPIEEVTTYGFRLYLFDGERYELTINKFSDLPKVSQIGFTGCTIKSLEGIEKARDLWVDFGGNIKFECGLLRMLKNENFNFDYRAVHDEKLEKALSIIDKYKTNGTHDIADAMDELMDEGLKEYAKL